MPDSIKKIEAKLELHPATLNMNNESISKMKLDDQVMKK